MSNNRITDWQKSIVLTFTSGGLFGYLLRSIRPIAILTSTVAGAALGSLVTYEYLENEQKNSSYHIQSNSPRQSLPQYESFSN